jgi:hypothetical protein
LEERVVEEVVIAAATNFFFIVEVFRQVATDASIVSLEGFSRRAKTLLDSCIILLSLIAIRAFFGVIVKIFWKVACNTQTVIHLIGSCSLAFTLVVGSIGSCSLEAILACSSCRIPELIPRTDITVNSIEEGIVWRTLLALLRIDVICLIILTGLACKIFEIKILRMCAEYTSY